MSSQMDPQLKALTQKYSDKLLYDPMFSLRVKTLYKVMLVLDPKRDRENTKAEAYVLACVLEETHTLESPGHPGQTPEAAPSYWQGRGWE